MGSPTEWPEKDAKCWMQHLSRKCFRAEGAMEISRWWSEAEPPVEVSASFASRLGRRNYPQVHCLSSAPAGAQCHSLLFRWFRFAPPPANFRRPSGTGTRNIFLKAIASFTLARFHGGLTAAQDAASRRAIHSRGCYRSRCRVPSRRGEPGDGG